MEGGGGTNFCLRIRPHKTPHKTLPRPARLRTKFRKRLLLPSALEGLTPRLRNKTSFQDSAPRPAQDFVPRLVPRTRAHKTSLVRPRIFSVEYGKKTLPRSAKIFHYREFHSENFHFFIIFGPKSTLGPLQPQSRPSWGSRPGWCPKS